MSTREHMLRIRPPSNKGKRYKKHKEKGPTVTKEHFLRALRGTSGQYAAIARRLGVGPWTVRDCLRREGWEDCAKAYAEECERIVDEAEDKLRVLLLQDDDTKTSMQATKYVLDHKGQQRGYGTTRSHVTLEGGKQAIKVETNHLVDITTLNLPLEVRKRIMAEIDANESPATDSSSIAAAPDSSPPAKVFDRVITIRRIAR